MLDRLPESPRPATDSYRDWERSHMSFSSGNLEAIKAPREIDAKSTKTSHLLSQFLCSQVGQNSSCCPCNCVGNLCMLMTLENFKKLKYLQFEILGKINIRKALTDSKRKSSIVVYILISVTDARKKGDRNVVFYILHIAYFMRFSHFN